MENWSVKRLINDGLWCDWLKMTCTWLTFPLSIKNATTAHVLDTLSVLVLQMNTMTLVTDATYF